jgi:molecular chaperone DnaK
VAVGAAVQAAVLTGEVKDLLLLDVTPLSLGIETLGGVMTRLIEANTTIPTKKSETFTTASDSQPSVEVHVLQGERPMARDNRTLGRFHLDGLPPAPRGVPQIEVTFDIDANGIVNASAKDKATGKQQNITITASSTLTKEDIERMKREAEAHAAEDAKNREEIEIRNHADSLVYTTERTLREHGDKVSAEDKTAIEAALNEAREALKGSDLERIKQTQETLTKASHKVAEAMYRAQAAGAGAAPGDSQGAEGSADSGAPGDSAKGDVIDAEFRPRRSAGPISAWRGAIPPTSTSGTARRTGSSRRSRSPTVS